MALHFLLLFFLLIFSSANATFLPFSSRQGFTFDTCRNSSTCRGSRVCSVDFSVPCSLNDPICFCLAQTRTRCTPSRRLTCISSELCAQDDALNYFCASKRAVRSLSTLSPAPLPGPSSLLTLSDCNSTSTCAPSLSCQPVTSIGADCTPSDLNCICYPNDLEPTPCLSSNTCTNGEVCAEAPLALLPYCIAPEVPNRRLAVDQLRYVSQGLTLDPCQQDADCRGPRRCFSTQGPQIVPCVQGTLCYCAPPDPRLQTCSRTGDCKDPNEVCSEHALFDTPICASIGARDAYRHIIQIPAQDDVCPLLLPFDQPIQRVARQSGPFGNRNRLRPAVVGGQEAVSALRQYMVGIFTKTDAGGLNFCSGVLVGRRWVLSAAHCEIKVGAGVAIAEEDLSFTDQREATRVKRVFNHPEFDISRRFDLFDIAVLELEDDAPERAAFMKVNTRVRLPVDNTAVRIVGYGLQGPQDTSPLVLRQVDVTTITSRVCQQFYAGLVSPVRIFRKRQICIRSAREGCGVCFGDSGGPLIQYIRGEPIVVGTSASLVDCGTTQFPQVFTRVAGTLDFLRSTPAEFEENTKLQVNNDPPCLPGEFLTSKEQCAPCPMNQVSRGGRVRKCSTCPDGLKRDNMDGNLCSCTGELSVGRGIRGGVCKVCPRGTFSGIADEICQECPPGTTSQVGASMCT